MTAKKSCKVVLLSVIHEKPLLTLMEHDPVNVGGRALLFHALTEIGISVPPSVCLGWALLRRLELSLDAVQQALMLGIEYLGSLVANQYGKALDAVVLRSNADRNCTWKPPLYQSLGRAGISSDYATVLREFATRFRSMYLSRPTSGTLVADAVEYFVLQAAIPFGGHLDTCYGKVWRRDPHSGARVVSGYVRSVGPQRPTYLTYAEWARTEPKCATQLSEWTDQLDEYLNPNYCLTFAPSADHAYVLDIETDALQQSARLALLEDLTSSPNSHSCMEDLMILQPEDISLERAINSRNLRDLSPLAQISRIGSNLTSGRLALTSDQVNSIVRDGDPVILATDSLSPRHVADLKKLSGVITRVGGLASHFVLLARGSGLSVLPGIAQLTIDQSAGFVGLEGATVKFGDWVTIDESTGTLYAGRARTQVGQRPQMLAVDGVFKSILSKHVLVNADTATEIIAGIAGGAAGIGLCRSENHLRERAVSSFAAWVDGGQASTHLAEIPTPVIDSLSSELLVLLQVAKGHPVHYRLLDLDLMELATEAPSNRAIDTSGESELMETLEKFGGAFRWRGCRWGLSSGFYKEQVRLAIATAYEAQTKVPSVDLGIVVPLVSTAEEFAEMRRLFDDEMEMRRNELGEHDGLTIRLGCMIETPRACEITIDLAVTADFLCFGTNDLTQAMWVLDRDSDQLLNTMRASGTVIADPFVSLDDSAVARILQRSIADARKARPDIRIIVCGEQANDPRSARKFIELGANAVSCRYDRVTSIKLALWQAEHERQQHNRPLQSLVHTSSNLKANVVAKERIQLARSGGRQDWAHSIALEWSKLLRTRLGLPEEKNWKLIKRDLVQHWFGKWRFKRFFPPWLTNDVLSYVEELNVEGHTVRYSLFPNEIACHAVSKVLDGQMTSAEWQSELDAVDHDVVIEVFPQAPRNYLCFRAIYWNSEIQLEAGIGQAMYVFENERGQHPVVRATIGMSGNIGLPECSSGDDPAVQSQLMEMLFRYSEWLRLRMWDMSNALGTVWLGVEGYYNPVTCAEPVVVDVDIPQDAAFLG